MSPPRSRSPIATDRTGAVAAEAHASGRARILLLLPELLALLIGIFLRVRFTRSHDPMWGYDAYSHLAYLRWVADKSDLPPITAFRAAYHPPLYYWIGGSLLHHGLAVESVRRISTVAGIAKLAVIAWALRHYLPGQSAERRLARLSALFLAAILPSSVHVDGMLSNEALNGLWCVLLLVLVPPLFNADSGRRWLLVFPLAGLLTAALITKVSSLVLVAAFAGGVLLELVWKRGSPSRRIARALPPIVAIAIALNFALPILGRHNERTGKIFATGFEGRVREKRQVEQAQRTPYLEHRPPDFFYSLGHGDIFVQPYWPSDVLPRSHFWPVLYASSFVDFYNYHFAGYPRKGEPFFKANQTAMSPKTQRYMQIALIAGLPILISTLSALLPALIWLVRKRRLGLLVALCVPIAAVLGQLHFAVAYPIDTSGPIKGVYMQFAAPPLFALFGLTVGWLWRRPLGKALALVNLAALVALATYSFYAVLQ